MESAPVPGAKRPRSRRCSLRLAAKKVVRVQEPGPVFPPEVRARIYHFIALDFRVNPRVPALVEHAAADEVRRMRQAGLLPALPAPEERARIRERVVARSLLEAVRAPWTFDPMIYARSNIEKMLVEQPDEFPPGLSDVLQLVTGLACTITPEEKPVWQYEYIANHLVTLKCAPPRLVEMCVQNRAKLVASSQARGKKRGSTMNLHIKWWAMAEHIFKQHGVPFPVLKEMSTASFGEAEDARALSLEERETVRRIVREQNWRGMRAKTLFALAGAGMLEDVLERSRDVLWTKNCADAIDVRRGGSTCETDMGKIGVYNCNALPLGAFVALTTLWTKDMKPAVDDVKFFNSAGTATSISFTKVLIFAAKTIATFRGGEALRGELRVMLYVRLRTMGRVLSREEFTGLPPCLHDEKDAAHAANAFIDFNTHHGTPAPFTCATCRHHDCPDLEPGRMQPMLPLLWENENEEI